MTSLLEAVSPFPASGRVRFDRRLVETYDVPGPRYTSYPPAPTFRDAFSPEDQIRLLDRSRDADRPLALYLHVPFCQTRCLFCGCNVVISRATERADGYLEHLRREAETLAAALGAGERRVEQVHWGGGTPNFLVPSQIRRLGRALATLFPLAPDAEVSVELDPRRLDKERLDAFQALGANRVSFGVQDLDPTVQRAIRRVLPYERLAELVDSVRNRGARGVNLDLIYGLPHQTVASFERTLERILVLAPDRLAVYNFAYLPERFAHQRALDEDALPDADERLAILELTIERLQDAGYLYLGLDHFVRPDDTLAKALADGTMTRSFQGYTTHGHCDLVGVGVSAVSRLADGFVQNRRDLASYSADVASRGLAPEKGWFLNAEDRLRADVIEALLCRLRVDKRLVESFHGVDFDRHFAPELARLESLATDGLVEDRADTLQITARGQLVARAVAMVFDEYLPSATTRFSRVV